MQCNQHRGQASGFIVFFLILALGAVLWGLLSLPAGQVFDMTLAQTSNPEAEGIIETRQAIWNQLLLFIVAFATIFLFARATVQSMQ